MQISKNLKKLRAQIPEDVVILAVSKTKPDEDILEAYEAGHRDFGENKIQEMTGKYERLPQDIKWHMIGHVQRNKVKYMAPFVHLIHAVDSLKLLKEINKQAKKNNRVIHCLLQIKIAEEESKYGLDIEDAGAILRSEAYSEMNHVLIVGLMGMATLTEDEEKIRREFTVLSGTFERLKGHYTDLKILSMGMSSDYKIAIDCGSNMVRVGSAIFGARNYN